MTREPWEDRVTVDGERTAVGLGVGTGRQVVPTSAAACDTGGTPTRSLSEHDGRRIE